MRSVARQKVIVIVRICFIVFTIGLTLAVYIKLILLPYNVPGLKNKDGFTHT